MTRTRQNDSVSNPHLPTAGRCGAPLKLILLPLALATTLALNGQRESGIAAPESHSAYLGFDRNDYPGDQYLPLLRKTFRFTGYWLNRPPGATTNTWAVNAPSYRWRDLASLSSSMAGSIRTSATRGQRRNWERRTLLMQL